MTDPLDAWTAQLRDWAIPQAILEAAPADPYAFPAGVISRPSIDPLATPTGAAVTDRLGPGERLLDVGCGAGRISGAFTVDHDVVGVEPRPGLAAQARERGIDVHEGRWPGLAAMVGTAPVVLCTHVLYDVQDPAPFLVALTEAATRRVVLEVTATHPWTDVGPLFTRFHDLPRPAGPTAEDLAAVVRTVCAVDPTMVRWRRPGSVLPSMADLVAYRRQQLCLTVEADPAVEAAIAGDVEKLEDGRVRLPEVDQATMWWDV